MKIKSDFITNSSSTSFIVIGTGGNHYPNFDELLVVDRSFGCKEFGWEQDEHSYTGSLIIFAYLQALYSEKEEYIQMLEEVIMENTKVKWITWMIQTQKWDDPDYGYIDHQSAYPENMEMFESKEKLKNFIFGVGSYIVTDNDNHD